MIGNDSTMFRWGVENELVDTATWQALTAAGGFKRGRSEAPETAPIKPVPEDLVAKTLAVANPMVHPMVQAMIRTQLLTGIRPGELVQLRESDIDRAGSVWVFRPGTHKSEYHEDRDRIILIGPEAQAVLTHWLRQAQAEYIFGSKQLREFENREGRGLPKKTANKALKRKRRPTLRSYYSPNSYLQAVLRACDRAGVGWWSPNQLRHNAAAMLRAKYGIEAAKVILGHSNLRTTQIYAEADFKRAEVIMKEVG